MSNLTTTNLDLGSVIMEGVADHDEILTFAGADDFVEGTILARDSVSLKLVLFAKGGVTNENGIPKAVLTYAVSAAGAGDVPVRALQKGKVNFNRLVIDSDGDNSNIDAVVMDQLRDYGIETQNVQDLSILDNQ